MSTQNTSHSHKLAMWIVTFSFFCGMAFPSYVQAKVDLTIAMEGDPDDGLDCSGGGGGDFTGGDGQSGPTQGMNNSEREYLVSPFCFESLGHWEIWFDTEIGIIFIFPSAEISKRRVGR